MEQMIFYKYSSWHTVYCM